MHALDVCLAGYSASAFWRVELDVELMPDTFSLKAPTSPGSRK